METFDRVDFLAEIEWLLPKDRAGNYCAEAETDVIWNAAPLAAQNEVQA